VTGRRTERALARAGGPLRRRLAWVGGFGAIGGLALVLATAAWSARAGLVHSPVWVIAAWAVAPLAALAALAAAARAGLNLRSHPLAERLERGQAWRAGALRGVIEPAADGTSDGLLDAADVAAAQDVDARAAGVLGPESRRLGRLLLLALGAAGGGLLLLGAAGVRHGPAALLWQPRRAYDMVTSPLRLEASRRVVSAGDSVTLLISAPGRLAVTLWTRAPGTTWERREILLDSLGSAAPVAGPLQESLYAHVTLGRRSSDTVMVTVRRPAFLASLALTVRYPAYLELEDEPVAAGGDTLLLPAGSRIQTRGEATVPIAAARWELGGAATVLAVDGTRFSGTLTPRLSGAYRLTVRTALGEAVGGDETVLAVRLVPDLVPVVEVPVPAGDTTAPTTGPVALVVDARDDHGLSDAVLERRLVRGGTTRALADQPLPLLGRFPDRAILPAAIDPAGLGLQPGDTLRITARVTDNSAERQIGRSRAVAIAIPTRAELRTVEQDRATAIARQLDSLVAASRNAQRQSEDLGRAAQRGADSVLDFDAAKKAETVAERQEQLVKEAEQVRQAVEELRQAAERAGINDSAFQQRLREVQEQLDRALTPELRRRLAELQEAVKALDRERTKEAIRRLGDQQQQLREALERSRELFKRAALEGELAALEQEAKELAAEQQKWNQQAASADSAQASAEEKALSRRADSVAAGLNRAGKQLSAEERQQALARSAEEAKAAAAEMREGAQAAAKGQRSPAQRAGQRASQHMSQVQREVQEQREAQQREWREEVVAELDRALLETGRLAERQLAVAEQFRRPGGTAAARSAQGPVEEGVQKLLEQVAAASGKNALVSPQILAALAEARRDMQKAREAAASASGNLRESAEKAGDAVDALNVAAYGLLRSREDVSGAGSGSGFAEAMERMTKLAQQQGQLSQDAAGLLPMAGSAAIQQQMQALAARQRALAQELERLRAQGQTDAKQLGEEAQDLARSLARGRLDRETVQRQERLFRRMLDAGRTLQGKEEDERKERQSETAKPGEIHLPAALRAQLMGKDGAIRLPTWEQLQRLSPEERRLVTEYFRRLAGGEP
jgi:hypothetical protein